MKSNHKPGRKRRRKRRAWKTISEDLWVNEILSRLPMKIIGRCNCVCKAWKTLISSQFCISTLQRLASSSTPPNSQNFLLPDHPRYALYLPQQDEHLRFSNFPFRFQDPSPSNLNFETIDVVNGVVCVSCSVSSSFDSIILWNPAIRKYIHLPRLSGMNLEISNNKLGFRYMRPPLPRFCTGIGFGYYDGDFKVVRVWTNSCYCSVKYAIFSCGEGVWREKESVMNPSMVGFVTPTGCFVNGTVHWLVWNPRNCYSLLIFDCGGEEFRTMELPGEISLFHARNSAGEYGQMTQFFKFAGMVSVLLCSRMVPCSEIWVMEKHGGWTKLFNLSVCLYFHNVIMLREDGDVYGPSLKELALYDHNKWIGKLGVERFYRPLSAHVYEPSLFLMEGRGNSYAKDEVVGIQLYHLQADTTRMSMWRCPPVNWIKLNARGIFKGEGHPAGAGVIFRDHEGKFIRAFSMKMEGESAIKTLLIGLRKGLRLARQMKIQSLIVELDEEKVVQALTASSSDLETKLGFELHRECKILIEGVNWGPGWRIGVCHAPRELNKVADWLAKTGMNKDAECVMLDDIPCEIEQLIASGM